MLGQATGYASEEICSRTNMISDNNQPSEHYTNKQHVHSKIHILSLKSKAMETYDICHICHST